MNMPSVLVPLARAGVLDDTRAAGEGQGRCGPVGIGPCILMKVGGACGRSKGLDLYCLVAFRAVRNDKADRLTFL